MKFLNLLLIGMMLIGIGTISFVSAQDSSDVITVSNAGGGEVTGGEVAMIILAVFGALFLLLIIAA